jgi:hypothetical protein
MTRRQMLTACLVHHMSGAGVALEEFTGLPA